MKAKFVKGILVGSMIGIGAGAMLTNNMSRGTKRKIKRYSNRMKGSATDFYDECMSKMK